MSERDGFQNGAAHMPIKLFWLAKLSLTMLGGHINSFLKPVFNNFSSSFSENLEISSWFWSFYLELTLSSPETLLHLTSPETTPASRDQGTASEDAGWERKRSGCGK